VSSTSFAGGELANPRKVGRGTSATAAMRQTGSGFSP
jgi:hypothetical protein